MRVPAAREAGSDHLGGECMAHDCFSSCFSSRSVPKQGRCTTGREKMHTQGLHLRRRNQGLDAALGGYQLWDPGDLPRLWGLGLYWALTQAVTQLGMPLRMLGSELPLGWSRTLPLPEPLFTWGLGVPITEREWSVLVEVHGAGSKARPEGPKRALEEELALGSRPFDPPSTP